MRPQVLWPSEAKPLGSERDQCILTSVNLPDWELHRRRSVFGLFLDPVAGPALQWVPLSIVGGSSGQAPDQPGTAPEEDTLEPMQ